MALLLSVLYWPGDDSCLGGWGLYMELLSPFGAASSDDECSNMQYVGDAQGTGTLEAISQRVGAWRRWHKRCVASVGATVE